MLQWVLARVVTCCWLALIVFALLFVHVDRQLDVDATPALMAARLLTARASILGFLLLTLPWPLSWETTRSRATSALWASTVIMLSAMGVTAYGSPVQFGILISLVSRFACISTQHPPQVLQT